MQKHKKHQFAHPDPETLRKPSKDTQTSKETLKEDLIPNFVYRDLKRTGYIITVFILLLGVLYLIQTKTDVLKPLLRIFGL